MKSMSKADTSFGSKLSKTGTGKKKKVRKNTASKTLKFQINLAKTQGPSNLFEPLFTIDDESLSPEKDQGNKSRGLRIKRLPQTDDSVGYEDQSS